MFPRQWEELYWLNQDLAAPVRARWMGWQAADLRAISPGLFVATGRTLGKWEGVCVSGVEVRGVGWREMQEKEHSADSLGFTWPLFGQMSSRSLIISIPGVNRYPCEEQLKVTESPNSFPLLHRWDWDRQGEQAERAVWLQGAAFLSAFPLVCSWSAYCLHSNA